MIPCFLNNNQTTFIDSINEYAIYLKEYNLTCDNTLKLLEKIARSRNCGYEQFFV